MLLRQKYIKSSHHSGNSQEVILGEEEYVISLGMTFTNLWFFSPIPFFPVIYFFLFSINFFSYFRCFYLVCFTNVFHTMILLKNLIWKWFSNQHNSPPFLCWESPVLNKFQFINEECVFVTPRIIYI